MEPVDQSPARAAEGASLLRPHLERGRRLRPRRVYLRALDLYATYPALDIEDALTVTHMEHRRAPQLYSYDADFDRVRGVQRLEPAPPPSGDRGRP